MPRRPLNHSIWSVADISMPAIDLYLNSYARIMRQGPQQCGDDTGTPAKAKPLRGVPTAGPAGDAQRSGFPIWMEGGVAVIEVEGVMVKGGLPWWGEAATDEVTLAMEAAGRDPDIGAVVARLNTPGGSCDGLAELADTTRATAAVKPVLAQVVGMCCSAGYMAACACTAIYAQRMDMIGSIGTRMIFYDFSKYYEENGIKAVPIDTGKFKSAAEVGTEITPEHKAYFQAIVDAYFADFSSTVTKGRARKMTGEQVKAASDGRVWLAPEALQMGLIDGIQGAAATMALARGYVAEQLRTKSIRADIAKRGETL